MSTQPTFVTGKRKYLFCGDEKGLEVLQPLIDKIKAANIGWEFFQLNHPIEYPDLSEWLSTQTMGSFLYASCEWTVLKNIKRLAEEAGFSDEEAQYVRYGNQEINVFCCRCHGISVLEKRKPETACNHCGLLLTVTDHYSSLRDACLGFVAKL